MSTRKGLLSSAGRSVVVAALAVLALTMGEAPMATAGPAAVSYTHLTLPTSDLV